MNSIDKIDFEPEVTEQNNVRKTFLSLDESIKKEMRGKSLDLIFTETSVYQSRLKRDSKKLKLQLKQISAEDLEKTLKEKLSTYNSKWGIFFKTMSIVAAAGGIAPTKYKGVFDLVKESFDIASKTNDLQNSKFREKFEHEYKKIGDYKKESFEESRSHEQDWKEIQSMVDAVKKSTEKTFEVICSSSAP